MNAFAVSHTRVDTSEDAVTSPVLQTRAPTGNVSGPTETLFESSPTTFHVMGLMVNAATAKAGEAGRNAGRSVAATTAQANRPYALERRGVAFSARRDSNVILLV